MAMFQVWLVATLMSAKPIGRLMHTRWGWPAAESIHFLGLSLLVGTILLFDLRLLGLGRRISIAALHKLIPWGIGGYAVNLVSGSFFLMAEPDQYIYNPAFHFKMLFMAVAGFNALSFYLVAARRTMGPGAAEDVPRAAKIIAVTSVLMWIAVIVCGRLLTFYRPGVCGPEGPGFLPIAFHGYREADRTRTRSGLSYSLVKSRSATKTEDTKEISRADSVPPCAFVAVLGLDEVSKSDQTQPQVQCRLQQRLPAPTATHNS
jgi:hypothetical protein